MPAAQQRLDFHRSFLAIHHIDPFSADEMPSRYRVGISLSMPHIATCQLLMAIFDESPSVNTTRARTRSRRQHLAECTCRHGCISAP